MYNPPNIMVVSDIENIVVGGDLLWENTLKICLSMKLTKVLNMFILTPF